MKQKQEKPRSDKNKTIILSEEEKSRLRANLIYPEHYSPKKYPGNFLINGDCTSVLSAIPEKSVDLLILDPPYNINKDFNGAKFARKGIGEYADYLEEWLSLMIKILKPDASIYICSDFHTSTSVHLVAEKYFKVRNRITWQREKGRGALRNWKNSSEDIWFCTLNDSYKFYVERVKEKRKVIAPYKENGTPKDWEETPDGRFRLTHPSNMWTDISIPYWSMAENTEHPTQKPEKLLAKLILASSDPGDFVFDPFAGSGSTLVTAKKLGRRFAGVEQNPEYCLVALKRLEMAEEDPSIQGYRDGVFWERNTFGEQNKKQQG